MSRQDTAHRSIAPRATARGLARRAYRTLVGPAVDVDPMRAWPGTATDELPRLRVLHVGDCGVRRMETSHDPKAPVGFPAVAAERLLQAGVGMEFFHYFAINYDYLPSIERLEQVMKLSGDPDVILVQLGASYARRVVVKDTPRAMQFRYEVSRRAGRLVFPWYRVLRPWVQRVGRHDAHYPGPAQLERTMTELQATWPSAEVVLMKIFPRSAIYPTSVPIVAQVDADVRAVAERRGVTLLDFADVLGRDPSYRCVAGYNLNGRGSELVGEKLGGWLIEHRAGAAAGALSR